METIVQKIDFELLKNQNFKNYAVQNDTYFNTILLKNIKVYKFNKRHIFTITKNDG